MSNSAALPNGSEVNGPEVNGPEVHEPQPADQESPLVTAGPEPSTGALVGKSFLISGPTGALIGLVAGMIAVGSSILDPVSEADFGGQRWVGFVIWLAIGGLVGAVLGAVTGVVVGPALVLLRIHQLTPVVSGVFAIGGVLFARRVFFGLAWVDYDSVWWIGDVMAAGLGATAAFVIGRVALNLLTPKVA